MTLVEDGELRKSLCIEKRYGESLFKQYIRLYEGCLLYTSCKIVFDGPKLEFIQIQYRNLPGKKVETYTGEFSQQDKD